MASNFRISVHRNRDSLHLRLAGDFDGSSAFMLLHSLKENGQGLLNAVIDTSGLETIYPFGVHVFEKNLSDLKGSPFKLLFTGHCAQQLAPVKGP